MNSTPNPAQAAGRFDGPMLIFDDELCEDWYERLSSPRPGSLGPLQQIRTFGLLALLIAGLNFYAPAEPGFTVRIFASLIVATAALPVWLWNAGFDRTFPLMPFLSALYALIFAVPVFLLHRYSTGGFSATIGPQYIAQALEYVWLGMLSMLAGYYGPLHSVFAPVMPRFKLRWRDSRSVRMAAILFSTVGLVVSILGARVPVAFVQLWGYFANLSLAGIVMLFMLELTGRLDRVMILLLWIVIIPAQPLAGLAGGALGGAAALCLLLLVAYASVAHRIPWTLIAAGALAGLILRAVETPYRIAAWSGPLREAGRVEKLEYFGKLVYRATIGGAVAPEELIEAGSERLAMFPLFAEVIRDTPSHVPYWGGATYYPIVFKLVPRLLYPDKPEEVTGQQFGHRYGFIEPGNSGTSVNLPQIVEMYANFGLPGVLIGMFLAGLLLRLIVSVFVHPEMGMGAAVAMILLAVLTFDIGSAASMVLGAVPWLLIFIAAVHLLVCIVESERRWQSFEMASLPGPAESGR
ncbi:MAG TPA: hypothetical protein VEC38_15160 [Candidatus Binataceae bacterium]|nr:hypothetical protein [Candidatus Binataceae bacterium]